MHAARKANSSEVGGLLLAEEEDDGFVVLSKPFLVKQKASSGEVDYDDDFIPLAIERMADEGVDPSLIRGSWHSHGSMGTFWSQTDKEYIQKIGSAGTKYLISIVVNNKGDHKVRLDMWDIPIVGHAYWDDLKLEILTDSVIDEEVTKEFEDWFEEKKYKTTPKHGGTGSASSSYNTRTQDSRDSRQDVDYGDDEEARWAAAWADKTNPLTKYVPVELTDEIKEKIKVVLPYWGLKEEDINEEDWEFLADMYGGLTKEEIDDLVKRFDELDGEIIDVTPEPVEETLTD